MIIIDTMIRTQLRMVCNVVLTSCWLEGYIEVPAHLHDTVWATYGWCDLQIEENKLVGITPTERPPEPEQEPKPPSEEDITLDMLAEHEERLCMLELTAAT